MEKEHTPVLLIAAAGQGRRMGGEENKTCLSLAGKPVLAHTLDIFLKLNIFSQVMVIIAPREEDTFRERVLIPFFPGEKHIFLLEGGRERQYSIFNGLQYLYKRKIPEESMVCIHDGARPLVSESLILSVYQQALSTGAAIAGIPLKDTIKEVDTDLAVLNTPRRDSFMAIQTPQCFKFSILWQAHCKAKEDNFLGSDDSSLVERLGIKVKVVMGNYENLKITTPDDLRLAETYLSSRRSFR
ncbi:MAG: 2-C-methyl-D-erythritol 4-phosphate cytidylyltransferase [Dethiobacter sp.]|jgi:2-C-methyl-D-erythritol 4-phosphate cytidylyltransferase|nr:MAG: 2-C-methyl-D-erythritol 4-phosphate cytidylyltransferase [Dethiobacter sp.]